MISKKDLLCRIEFLNSDISSLEDEVDAQRKEIDKLKKKINSNDILLKWFSKVIMDMENKLCVCKPSPKLVKEREAFIEATKSEYEKAYEKPVKRGRGRPRKNK